jgi:hypothetical protein
MKDLSSVFDKCATDDWLDVLPEFQRKSIHAMHASGASYDEIATIWIAAGASNTAPFSSGPPLQPNSGFYERLRLEIRAFLCGNQKYESDRDGILKAGEGTRTAIVSTISAAIAPHLGTNASVITPVIVLSLAAMGKMTLNAWCTTT